MPNMSYCRFRNTRHDMEDCLDALRDEKRLSSDEAAIPHLTRTRQENGTVCYFFGDTTIRVTETQTAGKIHLTPLSGDQVACGEWVDLDEEQMRRYCDLLTRYLNSSGPNDMVTEC